MYIIEKNTGNNDSSVFICIIEKNTGTNDSGIFICIIEKNARTSVFICKMEKKH
jgi:hypothetical protein